VIRGDGGVARVICVFDEPAFIVIALTARASIATL